MNLFNFGPGMGATVLAALLAMSAAQATAQQVFRIISPDGRLTFSDRPPEPGNASRVQAAPASPGLAPQGNASLPIELRTAVSRYPVALYTGLNCTPCDSARNLLASRGVPFSERSITTNADIEALKRLSGDTGLPFATIGSQHLRGFSDVEWAQFLDAAGYPRNSVLPQSYRQPAATPLVAAQAAAPVGQAGANGEAVRSRPARVPRSEPATPPPEPPNPAGIQF